MCCWFKGKVASCLLLRCVESLQQVLLQPNLYTCREADVPRPPQAINLNWVSEKRILRVQVRRLTLCYCNLIFLKALTPYKTLLASCIVFSVSAPFLLFPGRMPIYTHTLAWRYTRKDYIPHNNCGLLIIQSWLLLFLSGLLRILSWLLLGSSCNHCRQEGKMAMH